MTSKSCRYAHHVPNSLIESGLPASRVSVFCYLASRANKNRECWPSIETIAHALGIAEKTVKRCLSDLKTAGFIAVEKIKGRMGWARNKYRLPSFRKPTQAHVRDTSDPHIRDTSDPLTKPVETNQASSKAAKTREASQEEEELTKHVQKNGCITHSPEQEAYVEAAKKRICYHWEGHKLGCERVLRSLFSRNVTLETLISVIDSVGNNEKASKPKLWQYFEGIALQASESKGKLVPNQTVRMKPKTPNDKPVISEEERTLVRDGFKRLRKQLRGL